MIKKVFSLLLIGILAITFNLVIFAGESYVHNEPQYAPKIGEKGLLIEEKKYNVSTNGREVAVVERTYMQPSKVRGALRSYYKETTYSVGIYGTEKLDADFTVNSDYTVSCSRYYSSYSVIRNDLYLTPTETSANFSAGRRLSNGLHYYKIDTTYSYRKSQFWQDTNFSMSLTCDSSGGVQ